MLLLSFALSISYFYKIAIEFLSLFYVILSRNGQIQASFLAILFFNNRYIIATTQTNIQTLNNTQNTVVQPKLSAISPNPYELIVLPI